MSNYGTSPVRTKFPSIFCLFGGALAVVLVLRLDMRTLGVVGELVSGALGIVGATGGLWFGHWFTDWREGRR